MKADPADSRPKDWCSCSAKGSGNGASWASRLTPDEKSALEELDSGVIRRRIPAPEAERLLFLGLAELSFGSLVLTMAGRHALLAMRSN